MKNKLTKDFKTAVGNIRGGVRETGPFAKLETRMKRDFAVTSKKKYLKELNKRLNMLANELPSSVNDKDFSFLVTLPGKVHFNGGDLSVWRGQRKAFKVSYDDLRHLDGVKQIIRMAKEADIALGVQLFAHSPNAPSRELINAGEPTALGDRPWTMKRDQGAFTELHVYVDTRETFDAKKFPKKLPKPE